MALDIREIQQGSYYNCNFKIEQMLDVHGRPMNLSDAPLKGIGMYHGSGCITGRDVVTEMVEVVDKASNRTFTVGFDDIWNVELQT